MNDLIRGNPIIDAEKTGKEVCAPVATNELF